MSRRTYVWVPWESCIRAITADLWWPEISEATIETRTWRTPSSAMSFRIFLSSRESFSISMAALSFSSKVPKWSFFTVLCKTTSSFSSSGGFDNISGGATTFSEYCWVLDIWVELWKSRLRDDALDLKRERILLKKWSFMYWCCQTEEEEEEEEDCVREEDMIDR